MNDKVFIHDEFFPQTKSDKQIQVYINNYTKFDPEYIVQHCYVHRQETKNWIELLWKKYQPYAEPDFLKNLRQPNRFHSFSWHMYLASMLLDKNYNLQKTSISGPDLQIKIENQNIWIEAVATTPGKDKSSGGLPQSGAIYDSINPRIARITNELTKKYKIYIEKYIGKICKENEPFIIAINGYKTNNLDASRVAESAVYARGNVILIKMPDDKMQGGFYESKESFNIQKEDKEVPIPADYFCNDKYKEISGMIYCEEHIINANNQVETPENNLYFLINPYAKNKINLAEFNIGKLIHMDKNRQIIRQFEEK